jgi:hypothetical protein
MPLVGFKFKLFLKTGCKYREFFGFSKLLIWLLAASFVPQVGLSLLATSPHSTSGL